MSQGRQGSRRLTAPLATLVGVVVLIIGIGLAGRAARDALLSVPAYTIPIRSVQCGSPPGLAHDEFLDEVQYLGALPERLPVLDPELPRQLTEAFRRHPWVDDVVQLHATRAGIRADVRFRQPVLIVSQTGLVDREGRRLPPLTELPALPRLLIEVPPPMGPAGTFWGDDRVREAAAIAETILDRPVRGLAHNGDAWVLQMHDRRSVIWGRSPGEERLGEPDAPVKWRRLSDPTVLDLTINSGP